MFKRFRRLRLNDTLRNLVQETTISKDDFTYPLFVREGKGIKTEISSMPGVFQMSIDEILKECEYCSKTFRHDLTKSSSNYAGAVS